MSTLIKYLIIILTEVCYSKLHLKYQYEYVITNIFKKFHMQKFPLKRHLSIFMLVNTFNQYTNKISKTIKVILKLHIKMYLNPT